MTLRSAPWNPRALGVGDRDETLGVFVHNVEVWQLGQSLAVRDDAATAARRTIPPTPASIAALYEWFNAYAPFGSAANGAVAHHPIDHWAWYLAVAGLPRAQAIGALLAHGVTSALLTLLGLVLFLRTLPAGALRQFSPSRPHARRSRRPTKRAITRAQTAVPATGAAGAPRRKGSR